ncbi:MAG: bifunctional phosphoglucose/phosphomannose isomerase [Candidatus Omnitrophica bacterium]|nr:bifunctional phosphoglucose/phosphomannose isomerase [Candidatus Omnitrophota bacterium]
MKSDVWEEMRLELDCENFLAHIDGFPGQLREALRRARSVKLSAQRKIQKFSSVILCGMGGSAIGAEFVRSRLLYSSKIPIHVVHHYRLPAFLSATTLVIASSYSGNTEETQAALEEALRKKATLGVITSGGNIQKTAERHKLPVICVPPGMPPRMAMGYSVAALIYFLESFGICRSLLGEIEETAGVLESIGKTAYGISIPESRNLAKQIARKILGKIPVVYASCDYLEAVALRWREQIEENAKTLSTHGLFPEMTHNEIVGWREPKELLKHFAAFLMSDPEDHPRIALRFDYASEVIRKTGAEVFRLSGQGKSPLARMFSLAYLGDFVSYYLALLQRADPSAIEVIHALKKELAKT